MRMLLGITRESHSRSNLLISAKDLHQRLYNVGSDLRTREWNCAPAGQWRRARQQDRRPHLPQRRLGDEQ
jgi:hypothetical protein